MNPYAAPTARVEDAAARPEAEPVFFAVSLVKLALMSIVTLGLYEIYWFYKNWKCVERNAGDKVNAPIRSVFYPIMSYSLFRRVREHAKRSGVAGFPAGWLAVALFLVTVLWRLPDPWWLVSFLGFLPLVPVQKSVNAINAKLAPAADANARFTGWNVFGLVVGGIVLALSVVGAFVPQ